MRADLMSASYVTSKKKPIIYIMARNRDRERVRVKKSGVRPWFYVEGGNEAVGIHGEKLGKVVYEHPRQTESLRPKYPKTWRAKMPFAYNWLSSMQIFGGMDVRKGHIEPAPDLFVRPRIGYYDFEMNSPAVVLPEPTKPDWPIVTFQWMDSYTGEYGVEILEHPTANKADYEWVHYHSEEQGVMQAVIDRVREYEWDGVLGHYGNRYDWPYYYRRGRKIGFRTDALSPVNRFFCTWNPNAKSYEPNIGGMEALDSLEMYAVLTKPEGRKRWGFDLKLIVGNECGFWYEDYGDRIEVLWAGDHDTLALYGRNDVIALRKLDEHRQLVTRFDNIRRIFGCPMQWATKNMKFIHIYLTRCGDMMGKEIPTWQFIDAEKYRGASVQEGELVRGFHHNIGVFDLKSLYPNIIVALNLSLETMYYEDGMAKFHRTPEGLLPFALKRLMAEREKTRAARADYEPGTDKWNELYYYDQAFKYAVNSFYGAMKKIQPEIPARTTEVGRLILARLQERMREYGGE